MKKRIEIYFRYPRDCPARRVRAVPNTPGYFRYLCDCEEREDDILLCKDDFVFPSKCPLKSDEE